MNSFTHNELFNTCVRFRGKYIFFKICSYFIKQNSLTWLRILKTLVMAWVVEEHCLEIDVMLIQCMSF